MDLKEAREIVDGYEKLPADRYEEAVRICIEDDRKSEARDNESVDNSSDGSGEK